MKLPNLDAIKNIKSEVRNKYFYVTLLITAAILLISGFCFTEAWLRACEGLRDFGLSFAFFFSDILGIDSGIIPTVTELSPSIDINSVFPMDWAEFKLRMTDYGNALINLSNIKGYLNTVGRSLFFAVMIFSVVSPLFIGLYAAVGAVGIKENNNYNKDSKPLKLFRKLHHKVYLPCRNFIACVSDYIKERRGFYKLWFLIAFISLNGVTIIAEAFAYWYYILGSFDVLGFYLQFYKLILDLSLISRIPWWVWIFVAVCVIGYIRKKRGYENLRRFEARNVEFIQALPIAVLIKGPMNTKKTTFLTDISLSLSVIFRDKALELLRANDLKFPDFPWIEFELDLRNKITDGVIFNLASCRKYVDYRKHVFESITTDIEIRKSVFRNYGRKLGVTDLTINDFCYGYDYENYPMTYDDGLKVVDLWSVLKTYAQLYFIYTVESSLIISNYSIRTDDVLQDKGNFPVWDSDFFMRSSADQAELSRFSHILDFDMLRPGKKMDENNKLANAYEFGIIDITEVGKERGNMLYTQELKRLSEEGNQKNDLFELWLKMIRHAGTVDNFPFVVVFMDEQRAMSLGADARELCTIIDIENCSPERLCMPFFNTSELIYEIWRSKFESKYEEYRVARGDNTLRMTLRKSLFSVFKRHYDRIHNTFGYFKVSLTTQGGELNGDAKEKTYRLMKKKIYSNRFATDAFADYFAARSGESCVGINEIPEYGDVRATLSELQKQNSYFVRDLMKETKTTINRFNAVKPDAAHRAAEAAIRRERERRANDSAERAGKA